MKKHPSFEATTEASVSAGSKAPSAGSPASSAGSLPEFLTVRDLKEYLQLSQSAAYTLIHRSDFPSCRFGSSIRIPREPFLAWVEANTRIPDSLARYISQSGG
jgi:excisionase family DNA binding protein